MALLKSWSHQRLPIMASREVLAARTVAHTWYLPWAGSLPLSNPCHPQELARTAMSTLSRTTLRTRTTCTIHKTNRSVAPTARNQTTTTPTSRGWATTCGLHQFSKSVTPICITNYYKLKISRSLQRCSLAVVIPLFSSPKIPFCLFWHVFLWFIGHSAWRLHGLCRASSAVLFPPHAILLGVSLCLYCPTTFPLLHSTLIWFHMAAGDKYLRCGSFNCGCVELGVL